MIFDDAIPTAIREGSWQGETTLVARGGREIPVSQVMVAHKTAQGDVDFISTIARDITARKRVEQERILFRTLIDQCNDGIECSGPHFLDHGLR
jgi:hypothetical protein